MINKWSILLLFLCLQHNLWGQRTDFRYNPQPLQPLLSLHNFSEGGYQLISLQTSLGRVDSANCYYSNDSAYIRRIQTTLQGSHPAIVYPFSCNDSQLLLLCKDGQVIETITFSHNCHSATTANETVHSNGFQPLQMQKMQLQTHTFKHRNNAIGKLKELKKDSDLVFITPENWMQYEGSFGFFYDSKTNDDALVKKTILQYLQKEFPMEKFELFLNTHRYNSSTLVYEYHLSIRCQKTLFRHFKLARIDHRNWQAFPIIFTSYWK